ncbi:hypothetical protein DC3_41080 [Deinococcus cellulosilyticus NBRC 106333 = KACC 11606]|uniref:Uncharacterized protein n=2 Tax=Deinococcus cellulosilyticus TaxID=401558 RepID=A0A511N6K0_DEIC1|nr:hypothetical protein DC3_41080 [Deinococcus cellulosilyticus NBRC 106333 = KACC 11606]
MFLFMAGLIVSSAQAQSNFAAQINGLQGIGVEYEQGISGPWAASIQASYLPHVLPYDGFSGGVGIKYFADPGLSGLFGAMYLNGQWLTSTDNTLTDFKGSTLVANVQLHVGERWKLSDALALNLEGGATVSYWKNAERQWKVLPSLKFGVNFYF